MHDHGYLESTTLANSRISDGKTQGEAQMEVNRWGRGGKGKERKRSERINYCIICGRRRDGCLGRLARTPCKEDEKGPFCI